MEYHSATNYIPLSQTAQYDCPFLTTCMQAGSRSVIISWVWHCVDQECSYINTRLGWPTLVHCLGLPKLANHVLLLWKRPVTIAELSHVDIPHRAGPSVFGSHSPEAVCSINIVILKNFTARYLSVHFHHTETNCNLHTINIYLALEYCVLYCCPPISMGLRTPAKAGS